MSALAQRRTAAAAAIMMLFAVLQYVLFAIAPTPAGAVGGDFKLDFVASEPSSYDHSTGGGQFNDRTIGVDVVEQLEGGDFLCGDVVTYFTHVAVDEDASDDQTIKLGFSFTGNTTGQDGAGHIDITQVLINRPDGGTVDDGGSTAVLSNEQINGTLYQGNGNTIATVTGDVTVNDLDAGESVVIRIDTRVDCAASSSPTGNLQAILASSEVIAPLSEVGLITIGSGNQTIPFKNLQNIIPDPLGVIIVEKISVGGVSTFEFSSATLNPGSFEITTIAENPVAYPAFVDLAAGTYDVSETLTTDQVAAGWSLTNAICSDNSPIDAIDVAAGETVTCTFTNTLTPPPPPDEVTVSVAGLCAFDGVASYTYTVTADAGVTVDFDGGDQDLTNGQSYVSDSGSALWIAAAPAGTEFSGDSSGTATVTDCTPTPPTVTPPSPSPTGSIGDYVWLDANANGRQDDTELPAPGVKVELLNSSGAVLATTVTNVNGGYLFSGLTAGTYQVRFTVTDTVDVDYMFTLADSVDSPDDLDSDAFATANVGVTQQFLLGAGSNDLTRDAGLLRLSVQGIQIEPTTTTTANPATVEPVAVESLPFTGVEYDDIVKLALLVATIGSALAVMGRRERQRGAHEALPRGWKQW